MKPVLLLIDLQSDYLAAHELQPAAGAIVERAATLLAACRQRRVPVIHVQTTVHRQPDDRMPHWIAAGRWMCVAGTPGHEPPQALRPAPGEPLIDKQFFNGFAGGDLERRLREARCDTVIFTGVQLHACIRTTALEAYQRGFTVYIADDAVAGDDPVHAAITRRYLAARSVRFAPVSQLLAMLDGADPHRELVHLSPRENGRVLWSVPIADRPQVSAAVNAALEAQGRWRKIGIADRAQGLRDLADLLRGQSQSLAAQIAAEIGKPITMARGEIERSAALAEATASLANQPLEMRSSPDARYRHQPLGVVAVVTPWNNPLAIPIGKIAPALLYGNTVVWKPAPPATMLAARLAHLLREAMAHADLVRAVTGDASTAALLADHPGVDGLTLSGSESAGRALEEICARRRIPFQAELGGNNAAIVCDDADLREAAHHIALGAFAFAGQRCTANRRAIVAASCYETFVEELQRATAALVWADPLEETTHIGPVISVAKRTSIESLLRRARETGCRTLVPHRTQPDYPLLVRRGAYHPPTIVLCDDPHHEIVQEEYFGPILVVQKAANFDDALALCNGVRHGLIAALFSHDPHNRRRFLAEAKCGVLKLNRSTADADALSPFGGWKASGLGPAEHGPADREFFTRTQTLYGD